MPIFLCNKIMKADMMVITPRPPICMSNKMTICPNTLLEETVGTTTNPVTQVDVVAVNKASIKGTASPVAELMGNESNTDPTNMAIKKLSNMIWVVDNPVSRFFITASHLPLSTKSIHVFITITQEFDFFNYTMKTPTAFIGHTKTRNPHFSNVRFPTSPVLPYKTREQSNLFLPDNLNRINLADGSIFP